MGNNNNTTQCDRIMKYFRMFGSITQDEADKEFGIKRLASRIGEMRNEQHIKITSHNEKGINRFGEPCHYTRFYRNEVWFIGGRKDRYKVVKESQQDGAETITTCNTYDEALTWALDLQQQDKEKGVAKDNSRYVYKIKDTITGEGETIKW